MTTPTREQAAQAFNAYCKKKGITANGQFAVDDGMPFFNAGYNAARADLETELESLRKDALRMRGSIINWLQGKWPGTDQASVVDREYPTVAAIAAPKEK